MSLRVPSQSGAGAHAAAAERFIEDDLGIDHQRAVLIICAGSESNVVGGVDPISRVDGLLLACNHLIGHWLGLTDLERAGGQNEIAIRIDAQVVDAVESEVDLSGIVTGVDFEIVFEVVLISSKHQINSRIDGAPTDAAVEIVRCAEIAAEEIVGLAGHAVERFE